MTYFGSATKCSSKPASKNGPHAAYYAAEEGIITPLHADSVTTKCSCIAASTNVPLRTRLLRRA